MKNLRIALIVTLLIAIAGGVTVWNATQPVIEVQAQNDGWETDFSKNLGVTLLAEFDSSGPPAWDPGAHPLVFFTTEGPGYSGLMSGLTEPGVAIIDAVTKEPVASASFELEGVEAYFEPHGLGVSPDGRWIYLPTGTNPGFGAVGGGRLLIIDALTLKLNKVLAVPTNPHHAKAFTDAAGNSRVLAYTFREGGFYVLDHKDDNRVVGGVENGQLQGRGYLAFVSPDGKWMFISTRPPRGVPGEGFIAVVDTSNWEVVTRLDAFDSDPIWVAFTADSQTAYITGGHSSVLVRINMEGDNPNVWTVDGGTSAAAIGPYGAHLNWDEDEIWTVSKGEGAHNRGISLGLVNPTIMRPPPIRAWTPGSVGEFFTGCMRGDHGTLHPDPDLEELWVTCNGSFEIVVWDMFAREVIDRIPMPNGGSTHSGAFVQYEAGPMGEFFGEVVSDQNGLQGSALELKKELLGIAE